MGHKKGDNMQRIGLSARRGTLRAGIALLLIVLIFFSCFFSSMRVFAANKASKKTKSRAIAIVYDTSGSMYLNKNKAWCQANYAVQVFSALLNEGDLLQIYPMGIIEVGGQKYGKNYKKNDKDYGPLEIRSPKELDTIRIINTPDENDTPIESIESAYEGIKKVSAEEKWLIVLTDGAEFYRGGNNLKEETKNELSKLLSKYNDELNVQYLGIGKVDPPTIKSNKGYSNRSLAATSDSVPKALSEMSNSIFGRDVLEGGNKDGDKLKFDIPMSKLVLFVQGEGISNIKLVSSDGSSVGSISGRVSPKYSSKGITAKGYENFNVADTTLQGELVTITDVPSGEYTLKFDGKARTVDAYYEPDVDLALELRDSNGNIVDPNGECAPGKYTISYGMTDSDGKVVQSSLLGNTSYKITYNHNGKEEAVESNEAGEFKMDLKAEDTLNVKASVEFLSGYKIDKDGKDFGWPSGGLKFKLNPAGTLVLGYKGGSEEYRVSELEEKGRYTLDLKSNGETLSLNDPDVSIKLELEGGNVVANIDKGSGEITLSHPGDMTETECTGYTMIITAKYAPEDSEESESKVSISFDVLEEVGVLTLDTKWLQEDGYVLVSKPETFEPIRCDIRIDGETLSDEEMSSINLEVNGDGLDLESEIISGESAFLLNLKDVKGIKPGHHDVEIVATGKDKIGHTIRGEDVVELSFRRVPPWVPIVIGLAVLAGILAMVTVIRNQKVLPNRMVVSDSTFIVNGIKFDDDCTVNYTGGGKKSGTLTVQSPAVPMFPTAECSVSFHLEAVSPRKVKSPRRRAIITSVDPHPYTTGLSVMGETFSKDNVTNKWYLLDAGPDVPINEKISNSADIQMATIDGNLKPSLTATIEFKK